MEPVEMAGSEDWRAWLIAHHLSSEEIWIAIRKAAQGHEGLTMSDAIDEAICYGWIDSRTKRLDDSRYMIRFTPRKNGSNWSERNMKRAKQLLDEGRMDVSGISLLPADYRERAVHEGREEEWEVGPSPELEAELRKDHKIWLVYSDLSPGKRKEFNRWVFQAKRPETKRKRIERTVELIRMGRSLTEDMMQRTYKKKGGD